MVVAPRPCEGKKHKAYLEFWLDRCIIIKKKNLKF